MKTTGVLAGLVLTTFLGAGLAQAKGPSIKVGAIFSATGPAANLGGPEARTLEMFVQEANKKGGIAGRPIELVSKDSAGSPEKAISFAKQLIEEESKLKEEARTFGGHAYDALLLLSQAVQAAGILDKDKVRDALENLKGVVGTAGTFSFSAKDHGGLGADAFEMQTVKNGKFVIHSDKK